MERIFPNLYRFDYIAKKKDNSLSHCYLIVRKSGNLLICHAKPGANILDYADEIDKLGGVDTQFVAHFHDAKRGDLHEAIHKRFGAKLCYHSGERQGVNSKTKCPEIMFDNEGLKLGKDFEAHYFPGHTPGMTIFSWKHRGKRFLFPSHVVRLSGKEWEVSFKPQRTPELKSQFAELAKMDVDVLVRGGSDDTTVEYEELSGTALKGLQKILRTKLKPPAPKKRTSDRKLLITGYIQEELTDIIRESFDVEMVTGYGTCKQDVMDGYLAATDLIVFLGINRIYRPGHEFLDRIRTHVEKGGSALIADKRAGRIKPNWVASSQPFPEIGTLSDPSLVVDRDVLITDNTHPSAGGLRKKTNVPTASYAGITFEPGDKGTVLLRNADGGPVVIVGEVGKGRVILSGMYPVSKTPVNDVEKQMFRGMFAWLARG